MPEALGNVWEREELANGPQSMQKRVGNAYGKPVRRTKRDKANAEKKSKAKEDRQKFKERKQKERKRVKNPLASFYQTILSWPVLELSKDSRKALGSGATDCLHSIPSVAYCVVVVRCAPQSTRRLSLRKGTHSTWHHVIDL